MTAKILRRCDLCGKFHAAYLVSDEKGNKHYYCYNCWKAFQASLADHPVNHILQLVGEMPVALTRRLIYESRWINLYVDQVRFPNGVIIDQHHLLDFSHPAVMAIATDHEGRYFMVKVCRYPSGRTEWEFPAGSVEAYEEITIAAQRELVEETGYSSIHPEILFSYNPLNGMANQVNYIVRCQVIGAPTVFDSREITKVNWFTREEIWQMVRASEIRDGFTLTAFLLDQHL